MVPFNFGTLKVVQYFALLLFACPKGTPADATDAPGILLASPFFLYSLTPNNFLFINQLQSLSNTSQNSILNITNPSSRGEKASCVTYSQYVTQGAKEDEVASLY